MKCFPFILPKPAIPIDHVLIPPHKKRRRITALPTPTTPPLSPVIPERRTPVFVKEVPMAERPSKTESRNGATFCVQESLAFYKKHAMKPIVFKPPKITKCSASDLKRMKTQGLSIECIATLS
jgi:hypothetical protein